MSAPDYGCARVHRCPFCWVVERFEFAHCGHCGKPLGIYEPVVVLDQPAHGRRTSLALEPWLANRGAILMHVACAEASRVVVAPVG